MNISKKNKLIIPIVALVLLITTSAYKNDFFEIAKQIEIFTTLYKEINMNYVDETSPSDLMNVAIKNMLSELDPYTVFFNEQDVEASRINSTGDYTGIGATIKTLKDINYNLDLIIEQKDQIIVNEKKIGRKKRNAGLIKGATVGLLIGILLFN